MSTETVQKCDIYGTIKNVNRVRITIEILTLDGDCVMEPIIVGRDMCPRAFDRARHLIERATSPPGARKGGDSGDTE